MNYSGSALLLVILVLSSVLLGSVALWRGVVYMIDGNIAKQLYQQHLYSVQSLLNWGVKLSKNKFAQLYEYGKNKKIPLTFSFHSWPIMPLPLAITTMLEIAALDHDQLQLVGTISCNKLFKHSLSCIVQRLVWNVQKEVITYRYFVREWKSNS